MKTSFYTIVFLLAILFTSCNDGSSLELYNIATPEYMNKEAFRSSVRITSPRDIIESGKIYAYEDFVLINDVNKGIHILDNSNPINPSKKAFIEILANKDMEVRGNFLYADSLMDLVVFDISDLNNILEVTRIEDVFSSYLIRPTLDNLIIDYESYVYEEDTILVNWEITQEYREPQVVDTTFETLEDVALSSDAVSGGQGGSLARFKIVDEYLYAVDNNNINIFDISDLESPLALHDVYAGFGIETIFNRDNYLFLGSTNGMYIYDITSANRPEFVSQFIHATACDPVVVDEDYAYVTLRGGNSCGAFDSSLEIIDITDIQNPSLITTYSLDNPYGLGIKDDLLFICDGTSGLKIYNKENVEDLQLLQTYQEVTAYDVIPLENRLIMIGGGVLYQYVYRDTGLHLISEYSLN